MLKHLFAPKKAATPEPAAVSGNELSDGVLLEVTGVGKSYGDFWAVKDVSLSLLKGESLGIVGLNGAGKSTLLKVIAGSIIPTEGSIKRAGRVVALLDLSAGFNDDFSGVENLHLSASILGLPKGVIEDNLTEIEDFAEIGDFIRKPLRTYSTGMRVRLAFALLTQLRPDIMIIDEVLSVGDAYFAHKCSRLLRQFRDEGRSLLFVSHDPSAVKTYCDHAILLDRGRLIRAGLPADIIDYYNALIAAKERENEIRVAEGLSGRHMTRSGNQLAVLSRFDILDPNGKTVRAILCGTTVRIVCGIEFKGTVAAPTVGFMIRDRLGNEVFGTNTYYLGQKTRKFTDGECMEVAFSVTLNLGPGDFSCTIAVHAGADHREGNYDWRDNLLAISIIPNWPFQFAGLAALPTSVTVSDEMTLLSSECGWNEPINFASDGNSSRYLRGGWCVPEPAHCWTLGKKAGLVVRLPEGGDIQMEAKVFPFLPKGCNAQHVEFGCMDTVLGNWEVHGPMLLKAKISRDLRPKDGELRLWWSLPGAQSPASAGMGTDNREIALAFQFMTFSNFDGG
jgi:lipopolysaccharide transport system ATP-binding protein